MKKSLPASHLRFLMNIRKAVETDIGQWLRLVRTVRDSFPGLETDKALDEHKATALQFIKNEEAVAAFEESDLVGALLFSREHHAICFLAVDPKHRKKGIASQLLALALDELEKNKDVVVSTYRDTDKNAAPARSLYEKFGFQPEELISEFGYPCQVFRLHRQ